ncbi:hypothetical protein [Geodermatophilus sp. SYSU D00700]
MDEYMLAECGYAHLEISGTDHRYDGLAASLPTGVVGLTSTNDGTEPHEVAVFRIDDHVRLPWADVLALPENRMRASVTPLGSALAPPGTSETAFVRLAEPGRYGVACLVPQGSTTGADGAGPPHSTLGEFAEFPMT